MGYCSHLSTCPSQLLNDRDETERQLLHLTQALGALPSLAKVFSCLDSLDFFAFLLG